MAAATKKKDFTLADKKKLTAVLAAFDKTAVTKMKDLIDTSYKEACVQRGAAKRCVALFEGRTETDEYKAIASVRDTLVAGVDKTAL